MKTPQVPAMAGMTPLGLPEKLTAKRVLSPADIRGCLRIASGRPDKLRIIARDYPDADKRTLGMVSDVLNTLDLAISQGDPSYLVSDLTREVAHNWRPR